MICRREKDSIFPVDAGFMHSSFCDSFHAQGLDSTISLYRRGLNFFIPVGFNSLFS
jgi:hypothetical protein